ncbi:hypothetical protein ACVWXM_008038 [Bradyrhizobium sp. GM7.3]
MRSLSGVFGLGGTSLPSDGAFIGPVAKADGGYIAGPGGPRDDKIHARLSNGEFVINAASTAKHRAALEAINADRIPRFANGGLVGGTGSAAAPMIGHQTTVAPSITVNMSGNPGSSPAENQRIAENLAQIVQHHVNDAVGKQLRTQTRPGGVLFRR